MHWMISSRHVLTQRPELGWFTHNPRKIGDVMRRSSAQIYETVIRSPRPTGHSLLYRAIAIAIDGGGGGMEPI